MSIKRKLREFAEKESAYPSANKKPKHVREEEEESEETMSEGKEMKHESDGENENEREQVSESAEDDDDKAQEQQYDILPTVPADEVVYPGTVKKVGPSWVGSVDQKCKYFNAERLRISSEQAKALARAWTIETCKKHEIRPHRIIQEHNIPENVQKYTVGFIDGDGTICVIHSKRGKKKDKFVASMRVDVYQSMDASVPKALEHIQQYYGGHLGNRLRSRKENVLTSDGKVKEVETHRRSWVLSIYGHNSQLLLQHIEKYSIIKIEQARRAIKVLEKQPATAEESIALREKVKALHHSYDEVEVDASRLSAAYLSGFFDAEGSLGVYQYEDKRDGRNSRGLDYQTSLWQCGCRNILHAIREKLGVGTVTKCGSYMARGKHSFALLEIVYPLSLMKKEQIELYCDSWGRIKGGRKDRLTQEEIEETEYVIAELQRLKRL